MFIYDIGWYVRCFAWSKSNLFLNSFTDLFWISGLLRLVQSGFAALFVFLLFDLRLNLKCAVTMRLSDATLSKEQNSAVFANILTFCYLSLCNQAELYFRLVTCVSIVDPFFFYKVCLDIIHYFLKYNLWAKFYFYLIHQSVRIWNHIEYQDEHYNHRLWLKHCVLKFVLW